MEYKAGAQIQLENEKLISNTYEIQIFSEVKKWTSEVWRSELWGQKSFKCKFLLVLESSVPAGKGRIEEEER